MNTERYSLLKGNNIDLLKGIEDNSISAVVTDPPYGMGKAPNALAMLRDWIETGHHDHKGGGGFMGLQWDAFVPQPAFWHEVLRVMKPGAYGVAFASTRTADLMGLSIRLAGLELCDQLAWCYGSGFPKGQNVGKAIDKKKGAKREVVGHAKRSGKKGTVALGDFAGNNTITAPATEEAAEWEGWNTALKPAYEPIILFQKPFKGTIAENVLKWHTGALNVDACRVGTEDRYNWAAGNKSGGASYNLSVTGMPDDYPGNNVTGRYPANLMHDGSEEVLGLFPETESGKPGIRRKDNKSVAMMGKVSMTGKVETGIGDKGSAARFFYCAKPSQFERNLGAGDTKAFETVKPVALMEWLCKLLCPRGETILDPFMGSGTTGIAAMLADPSFQFIGMEMGDNQFRRSTNRMKHWAKYRQFIEAAATKDHNQQPTLF